MKVNKITLNIRCIKTALQNVKKTQLFDKTNSAIFHDSFFVQRITQINKDNDSNGTL